MSDFLNIETSSLAELLPQQIRMNSDMLVRFLEDYYRFINSKDENGPSYIISRIIAEHDIDRVVDPVFLAKIQAEIAEGMPDSPYVLKAFLLKRIVEYYDVRGSDESVKYFFRIFFNTDVKVYYPWDRVLMPSTSGWARELRIRVVLDSHVDAEDFVGKTIYQPYTKATAFVVKATRHAYATEVIYDLVVKPDTVKGTFVANESVEVEGDSNVSGTVYRSLTRINIVNGGTGYVVGDIVKLDGIENDTFRGIVETVGSDGRIKRVKIIEYGSGNSITYNTVRLIDFVAGEVEFPIIVYSEHGEGAEFSLSFGALVQTFGEYANDKSHPSGGSAVLQDSYYFQKFSYEITSDISLSIWNEAYRDLLHPAGMIMFNKINAETSFDAEIANTFDSVIEVPEIPQFYSEEEVSLSQNLESYLQTYFAHADEADPDTIKAFTVDSYVIEPGTLNDITEVDPVTNASADTYREIEAAYQNL